MPAPDNLLQDTYRRYLQEKGQLEERLSEIKVKIAALEEAGANAQKGDEGAGRGELTKRILATLKADNSEAGMSHSDMKDALLEQGFKPGGKLSRFPLVIAKAMTRLRVDHKIFGEMKDNAWRYKALERAGHSPLL